MQGGEQSNKRAKFVGVDWNFEGQEGKGMSMSYKQGLKAIRGKTESKTDWWMLIWWYIDHKYESYHKALYKLTLCNNK